MTDFILPAPPRASLAISGSDRRFALRRVFCVGRNYADHAREMGADPTREPPFFFYKPADAVVDATGDIPYPPLTEKLHHEVELVVALGRGGSDIAPADALRHVWGYAVGIDLTRRDLQDEAKKASRPWDWAKGFDHSGPCGPLVPAGQGFSPEAGRIWMAVNGELRQEGDLSQMIWPLADIIAQASRSVKLCPGDLIFTGTPAGVGVLARGDEVSAGIDGLETISFSISEGGA